VWFSVNNVLFYYSNQKIRSAIQSLTSTSDALLVDRPSIIVVLWVKPFKLDPSVAGGEAPVAATAPIISIGMPGGHRGIHFLTVATRRSPKHCRDRMLSSCSAMFSQLPFFGLKQKPKPGVGRQQEWWK